MDHVSYAVMASCPKAGASGEDAGYDVMEIQGHDAEGATVFLWLKLVGWSRTLEGVRSLLARRTAPPEDPAPPMPADWTTP
jgi:hypothetical protein